MISQLKKVIRREGFFGIFSYVMHYFNVKRKLTRLLMGPVAIPLASLILAISPWIRIRLILLFSNRIGHYPYNTELLLCVRDAIPEEKNCKTLFYTIPGASICNSQLHRMWKRTITILPFSYLTAEVDRYLILWSNRYRADSIKRFFIPKGYSWDAWNLLGKTTGPHIRFTVHEEKMGLELLKSLGIPENARFICLLGRDARYLSVYMPEHDLSYTNYRNVDIDNYQPAAQYLAENGYYVIRMGRHVEKKFTVQHPNVIDYADSPFCSDFGDIYLSAKCFFFISVSCGLDAVAQIFRRPILQTNVPLVDPDFHPEWHLMITKKMLELSTGKYLTPKEIAAAFPWLNSNGARSILTIAKDKGLSLVENTPEEITEVVKEMVERLNGAWKSTIEDEHLQRHFWQSFKDPGMRLLSAPAPKLPGFPQLKVPVFEDMNIDYNRKVGAVRCRVGNAFLKSNALWMIEHNNAVELSIH